MCRANIGSLSLDREVAAQARQGLFSSRICKGITRDETESEKNEAAKQPYYY